MRAVKEEPGNEARESVSDMEHGLQGSKLCVYKLTHLA